jgi:hypothetical protein
MKKEYIVKKFIQIKVKMASQLKLDNFANGIVISATNYTSWGYHTGTLIICNV